MLASLLLSAGRLPLGRPLRGVLVSILLTGCAADRVAGPVPPSDEDPAQKAWQQRNERLARLDVWEVRGRLSLRLPEEAVNASFEWRQDERSYGLDLSGPLGQGQVKLRASPGAVTLTTAQGDRWTAPSAEALLKERLNWDLPVAGLNHWLLGRAAPESTVEALEVDELGRPLRLSQDGWTVLYQTYITYQGIDVPTKLRLERPGVRARVLASRWAFDAP